MLAIFTGEDCSMGLMNGGIYDIEIKTSGKYIIVSWLIYDHDILGGFFRAHESKCPYTSLKEFSKNWKDAEN